MTINGFEIYKETPYDEFPFTADNQNYSEVDGYNIAYLKGQEQRFTKLLNNRGHVMLNDVFDVLGMPRTRLGSTHGWVKNLGPQNIIFGLELDINKDFMSGKTKEAIILPNFNIKTSVWDSLNGVGLSSTQRLKLCLELLIQERFYPVIVDLSSCDPSDAEWLKKEIQVVINVLRRKIDENK